MKGLLLLIVILCAAFSVSAQTPAQMRGKTLKVALYSVSRGKETLMATNTLPITVTAVQDRWMVGVPSEQFRSVYPEVAEFNWYLKVGANWEGHLLLVHKGLIYSPAKVSQLEEADGYVISFDLLRDNGPLTVWLTPERILRIYPPTRPKPMAKKR